MAKALVIRNADFSACAIETVTFTDIPCTGISLNKSQMSLAQFGATDTLAASLTPLDTTDPVLWTTSDPNIATVVNGVVTAVGIGTAIITATCGIAAATCTVTAAAYFDPSLELQNQFYSTTTSAPASLKYTNVSKQVQCAGLCSRVGTYPARLTSGTTVSANCYPIRLPYNVKSIHVVAANCYIGISWSNTMYAEYLDYAVGLGGNTASSSANVHDDVWYDVPDGADSLFLVIRNMDGSTMTQEVYEAIEWSVTYSTDVAPSA